MNNHEWSDGWASEGSDQMGGTEAVVSGNQQWLRKATGLIRQVGGGHRTAPHGVATVSALHVAPENLVVIVQIASQRVSATVAVLSSRHGDKVVAHKTIDCLWHDLNRLGKREAVADAVRLVCDSAGVEAYSVHLSMSDASFTSRLAMGWADPAQEVVLGEHEAAWALRRAREQATGADQELIDAVPVQWTVRARGGECEVADPVGQRGSRLTCQALLVTARAGYRAELQALARDLDLELEGVIAPPVALYRGICGSLPRKGSTLVIDCGARCTTFLVRRRERLVHLETHPFGGDDLTRRLAERLNISWAQAEDLKRDLDIGEPIRADTNLAGQQFIWGEMREKHRLIGPGARLCAELAREFFHARAQELRENGHLGQQGQVHLVGRASALGGLGVLLKEEFSLPVVLGTGQRDRDPSAELADLSASGLVCVAADQRRRHLAGYNTGLRKTASGVWSWLGKKLE